MSYIHMCKMIIFFLKSVKNIKYQFSPIRFSYENPTILTQIQILIEFNPKAQSFASMFLNFPLD